MLANTCEIRERLSSELLKQCKLGLLNKESEHLIEFYKQTKHYAMHFSKREMLHLIRQICIRKKLNNIE